MLGAFCYTHGNYYSEFEGISVAATTFEQVSAVAKRVSDAYGARAATQFLGSNLCRWSRHDLERD